MHVSEPTTRQLRWYLWPVFWLQRRRYGVDLIPARVWARVPALYWALGRFNAALERSNSPLEPALRSLVQARVSQINRCAFCVDLNTARAAERAGSLDKAMAVSAWRDSERFSALEKVALEYAEVVTQTGQVVSPDLMARLHQQLDEPALIELTALVAFQNLSSKFNAALDIPAQGFCERR